MPTTGRTVAIVVVVGLLSGTVGGVVGALLRRAPAVDTAHDTATCDVADVAARVFPSLVTVNARGAIASGTGSGSVLDRRGHILTNDHVIEAATAGGSLTVDFARGRAQVPAAIVGRDPASDLAVIRVAPELVRLTPITAGASADLVVGQPVVAAGSPLGLTGTITSGVVSALSRHIDIGQGPEPTTLVNAVQTDASINPGNSGGPLTDCSGRQVGVNTAGASVRGTDGGAGSIGLNFAIPMDFARSVADQIVRTGRVTHPTIGALGVTVTAEMADATGMPRGMLVAQVMPGLGAARAGMRRGDVITRIGDRAVDSVDETLVAIRRYRPGDTAQVTYTRDRSSVTARVAVTGA